MAVQVFGVVCKCEYVVALVRDGCEGQWVCPLGNALLLSREGACRNRGNELWEHNDGTPSID